MELTKHQRKIGHLSRAARASMTILLLTGLAACADSTILNDLTGEPERGSMANRAGILRVDSREAVWPNLADVPPRPANVTPLATRQQERDALAADREAGLKLLQMREPTPPTAMQKP